MLRIAFWTLSLLIGATSLRFLLLPVDLSMPHMLHYLTDHGAAAYGHLIFGPLALLLAPFQLWTGLRQRQPRLHRAMGYLYALSIAVAGLASLAMLPGFQGPLWVATGFATLAVLWIGFTATGIMLARRGDHAAHQRWMQRSVALTFAAVTLRLMMAPLMAMGWQVVDTYQITAWGSWLINLAVLEAMRKGARKGALSGRSKWSGRGDSNARP